MFQVHLFKIKKYVAFMKSGPREFWKTPLNWLQCAVKLMPFTWDRIMGPRWK